MQPTHDPAQDKFGRRELIDLDDEDNHHSRRDEDEESFALTHSQLTYGGGAMMSAGLAQSYGLKGSLGPTSKNLGLS